MKKETKRVLRNLGIVGLGTSVILGGLFSARSYQNRPEFREPIEQPIEVLTSSPESYASSVGKQLKDYIVVGVSDSVPLNMDYGCNRTIGLRVKERHPNAEVITNFIHDSMRSGGCHGTALIPRVYWNK